MKLKKQVITWLSHRLPACKEVTRLASDKMERQLSLRQRLGVKLHLLMCSLCKRYVQQLQAMREVARQHTAMLETDVAKPSAQLSNEARERLKQMLQA